MSRQWERPARTGPGAKAGTPLKRSDRRGRCGPSGRIERPPEGCEAAGLGDEVERSLLAAQALIASTVAKHRDRSSETAQVMAVEPDDAAVLETITRLIERATASVDLVLAVDPAHARVVYSALRKLLVGGGSVTARVLWSSAALDPGVGREQLGTGRAPEVRVARIPLVEAVIVDGQVAFAGTEVAGGRQASVVRVPSAIRTMQTLFESVWQDAGPVQRLDVGEGARSQFAREILKRLHAGSIDDVAARELSVSVRTYRRYVAEIMETLGATSRFQAGVRAAEAGLLPPADHKRPDPGRP
jgi:hypothetical protein